MAAKRPVVPSRLRIEHVLLCAFILSRLVLLHQEWGVRIGWDVGSHLDMLNRWPWDEGAWDVRSSFYAYHPPLAFLFARALHLLGLPAAESVQTIGCLVSIAAFFFLRGTVSLLGKLRSPEGIAFVYVTSALPVQQYLAYSINMDVFVYAAACAVAYFSVLLVKRPSIGGMWGLAATLAVGMLIKSSSLLLFSLPAVLIPLLLLPLFRKRTMWRKAVRAMLAGALSVALAIALVSPYYAGRYWLQEGALFVSNMDFQEYGSEGLQRERKDVRDVDRGAFIRDLFSVRASELLALEDRDQGRVRLVNTWRDVWAGSRHNVQSSLFSSWLSHAYSFAAIALLVAGVVHLLVFFRGDDWDRFTVGMLFFGMLQMAALVAYAWKYPHPIGLPTKLIYIAPVLVPFGLLLTRAFAFVPALVRGRMAGVVSGAALLGAYLLLNGILPVY